MSEWSSSAADFTAFQNKCYDIIEEIGQYYVDKIRAQGGKNDIQFFQKMQAGEKLQTAGALRRKLKNRMKILPRCSVLQMKDMV